ncbi:uncharacterized protein E1O_19390 [Burkholderiales bacterium GJ-E10]|nr:uncharacterized protein E1O_19390 [Burkholderiales bacterium GJ-E10]
MNPLEWTGSVVGLLGSALLATHTRVSRYGWFAYLIANIAMGLFAFSGRHYGLLVQQMGFTVTSVFGIYRAFQSSRGGLR